MRQYREEIAKRYAEEEEEALRSGDFEEVVVNEFHCAVCKKTFKNEKQLQNHLQSKKHTDAMKKFKDTVQLDQTTEELIQQEKE